jgi:formylglycine-generating enzyme required for sulfatase activity
MRNDFVLPRKNLKWESNSSLKRGFSIWALATVMLLVSMGARAQVKLVPSAPIPVKPSAKPKTRIRKTSVTKTAGATFDVNSKVVPQGEGNPSAVETPQPMGFPIVKPSMAEMDGPKSTVLSATVQAPPVNEASQTFMSQEPATVAPQNDEMKSEPKPMASKAPVSSAPPPPVEPAAEAKAMPAAEIRTNSAAPNSIRTDRLLSYSFDVILTDIRGKISTSGKETRRYLTEELPGGTILEMVEVVGGAYMMGRSAAEIGDREKLFLRDLGKQTKERVIERLPAEGPQHAVKVAGFFIGKFEITQSQWRAAASWPKVKRDLMSDPSQFKGGNLPVENVSWEEAVEFCERLSRATGRKYRLPTEAEWEYACRGGSETPFHFGQTLTSEVANFDAKRPFLTSPSGDSRMKTVPAGSLGAPNGFGLYDMHGNIWEWCADNWHDSYQSAPSDGSAWLKGGIAYLKVVRGGAWDSAAIECRSSFRDRLTPMLKMGNIGFRVVLEAAVEP